MQSHQRTEFVLQLRSLSPGDFSTLIAAIPGAGFEVGSEAPVISKIAQLVEWSESTNGPGLDEVQRIYLALFSTLGGTPQKQRPIDPQRIVGVRFLDPGKAFRGRPEKMEELKGLLRDQNVKLVCIVGGPGIGKTALLSKLCEEIERGALCLSNRPPADGIVYVSCRATDKLSVQRIFQDTGRVLGDAVAERLMASLQASRDPNRGRASIGEATHSLLSELRTGCYLLVLDNFEDMLDEGTAIADPELREFVEICLEKPHALRLLVTSRIELKTSTRSKRAASVVRLDEGLPADEAAALLGDLLNYLDPNNEHQLRDIPAGLLRAAAIKCRGIPRALETIACLLWDDHTLTLAELLENDSLFGKQVVESLVAEHYQRLSKEQKKVLEALAVYARPIPAEAVSHLRHPFDSGFDEKEAKKSLNALARNRYVIGDRVCKTYDLHSLSQEYIYHQVPDGGRYSKSQLHSQAAGYFRLKGKPADQLAKREDIDPQLSELYHLIRAGLYHDACCLLNCLSRALVGTPLRQSVVDALLDDSRKCCDGIANLLDYIARAAESSSGAGALDIALECALGVAVERQKLAIGGPEYRILRAALVSSDVTLRRKGTRVVHALYQLDREVGQTLLTELRDEIMGRLGGWRLLGTLVEAGRQRLQALLDSFVTLFLYLLGSSYADKRARMQILDTGNRIVERLVRGRALCHVQPWIAHFAAQKLCEIYWGNPHPCNYLEVYLWLAWGDQKKTQRIAELFACGDSSVSLAQQRDVLELFCESNGLISWYIYSLTAFYAQDGGQSRELLPLLGEIYENGNDVAKYNVYTTLAIVCEYASLDEEHLKAVKNDFEKYVQRLLAERGPWITLRHPRVPEDDEVIRSYLAERTERGSPRAYWAFYDPQTRELTMRYDNFAMVRYGEYLARENGEDIDEFDFIPEYLSKQTVCDHLEVLAYSIEALGELGKRFPGPALNTLRSLIEKHVVDLNERIDTKVPFHGEETAAKNVFLYALCTLKRYWPGRIEGFLLSLEQQWRDCLQDAIDKSPEDFAPRMFGYYGQNIAQRQFLSFREVRGLVEGGGHSIVGALVVLAANRVWRMLTGSRKTPRRGTKQELLQEGSSDAMLRYYGQMIYQKTFLTSSEARRIFAEGILASADARTVKSFFVAFIMKGVKWFRSLPTREADK